MWYIHHKRLEIDTLSYRWEGMFMRKSRSIYVLLLKHFLLASLLPTLLLSALVCAICFDLLVDQAVQKNMSALELASAPVEENLDTVRSVAIMLPALGGTTSALSANSLYSLLLSCDDESELPIPPEKLASFKLMQSSLYQVYFIYNQYINGIHIVLDHGTVLSFGSTITPSGDFAGDMRALMSTSNGQPQFMPAALEYVYAGINSLQNGASIHSCLTYLSELKRLDGSGETLALLVIDMNAALFQSLRDLADSHAARIYAIDAQGRTVYSSDGEPYDGAQEQFEPGARYELSARRMVCAYPLADDSGITILYVADIDPVTLIEPTLMAALVIIALAVAYSLIMTVRNARRFSQPIMRLCEVMTSGSDMPRSIAPYYDMRELRVLYMRYNDMLDSISRHIDQKYNSEIALERMRMKAMEAQMDSHFLYNTLECIYSMALLSGTDDVAQVAKSLSDTLRYISRTEGPTVTVRQELAHVQDYITIQRARLGDDVSCIVSVDAALLERHMLKLTLQPLVENAFKHGLVGARGPRNVYLAGEERGGWLVFTVRDNGVGMDADRLRQVRRGLDEPQGAGEGVGLSNISRRLKLYYGATASLEIESEPMQGTLVTLSIPEGDVR